MPANKKLNVLVFPCGAENASEIYQALRYSQHVQVTGASGVEDHGRFRFPAYIGDVPNISDPQFAAAFDHLIRAHQIDVVFATHDSVAEQLAILAASGGFYLVNGDVRATWIARRKRETYRLFQDCAWTPQVWQTPDEIPAWPVIVKPDMGQGAQGVSLVANADAARSALASCDAPLLVEYLPGDELTVDCFTDARGDIVWIGPRTRERVRAGITMRSRYVEVDEEVSAIARTINQRMTLRGPWFFQLKRAACGVYKLLEVSCRISGTMVFQRARGVNLPLMAIHDVMGRRVAPLVNPAVTLIDRCIQTRARIEADWHHLYVDLDDTLIINGRAVPQIVSFIYQSIAADKKVYLITRHERDVNKTLCQARLSPTLFDAIYHITDGQSKARYIRQDAIFIDNYFVERKDVYQQTGCVVLDVDAVELLLC